MAGKKNNKINPLIMVLICAVLLYGSLNSLSTLALGLWGEDVVGTLDYYHSRLEETRAANESFPHCFQGLLFLGKWQGIPGPGHVRQ